MNRHNLIKDMREDCECEKCNYCPLEEIISVNQRMFEQHKLVEGLKYKLSEKLGREVDWNEAYIYWKDEKYAKRFAEIYREGMDYRYLRERVELAWK